MTLHIQRYEKNTAKEKNKREEAGDRGYYAGIQCRKDG